MLSNTPAISFVSGSTCTIHAPIMRHSRYERKSLRSNDCTMPEVHVQCKAPNS